MDSLPIFSLSGLVLMLAGVSILPVPSAAEDGVDLILDGGRFYPVSSPGPVEGSLAIDEGRIVYLGPEEGAEALAGPGTRIVRLGGRAVTPGLIDSHSHLLGLGSAFSGLAGATTRVDLVGTVSYQEVIERVRKQALSALPGTWIRGRGWDQNDWGASGFPEHQRLSAEVPDHPVWLTRVDGHAALLNARAMDLLGIDRQIQDPPGGRFLRDHQGEPTGVLIDAAMGLVRPLLPAPQEAQLQERLRQAAGHCLSVGLTTVTEMGADAEGLRAYRSVESAGELPLRVAVFLSDEDELLAAHLGEGPVRYPSGRLLVRGVKTYVDGALGSRGAALLEPYSDDPGNSGLLQISEERLRRLCRMSVDSGFQLGVHAIGDRGARVALDAIESCFEGRPRPELRFRLEHAQVMRPVDIERMARLGILAAMQPTHATSDMPWAEQRLGEERTAGAYAWRKMLVAGVGLALGSDFPVESANPLLGIYAAVTRQDLEGRPPGGWLPGERLSREEALRGFTLDAARSLFLDREVGSLEAGKRADLVVFERDPMAAPAAELPRIRVDLTLVDGRIVFERSEDS